MKITNETLQIEKAIFDNLVKDHKGYSKKAHQGVLEALKQYKATGKYPYNAQVKDFILSLCDIKAELHDYLETEVYLAQQDLGQEEKAKLTQDMADKGFIPCSEWKGYIGKAQLVGKKQLDWATASIDTTGKIIITNDGQDGFFIPKGKRSRGYYLRNLDEAYYKAIN